MKEADPAQMLPAAMSNNAKKKKWQDVWYDSFGYHPENDEYYQDKEHNKHAVGN